MSKRYRIYREHKYVLCFLAEFEQFIAKMDFRSQVQVDELSNKIDSLIALMQGHAEHEDKTIHQLLRNKGSQVQIQIEAEHQFHNEIFTRLKEKLKLIQVCKNLEERISLGYEFYLSFREFEAENLKHINEEENIIMHELQRLYTDEELRTGIDFKTYEIMSADEMVHMLKVLFPTYNVEDKKVFLKDILDAQPEKFKIIFSEVSSQLLTQDEKIEIMDQFAQYAK